jgi:hypothetical protein
MASFTQETSIIDIIVSPFVCFGIGLRKFCNWELSIYLPFLLITIEFKKKTYLNNWIDFGHNFR